MFTLFVAKLGCTKTISTDFISGYSITSLGSDLISPDVFSQFCLILGVGVLHGAVVLITELCGQNPEALGRFRKVRRTHTPLSSDL